MCKKRSKITHRCVWGIGGGFTKNNIVEIRKKVDKETGEVLSRQKIDLPNYFDPNNGYKLMARTKNIRVFPDVLFTEELTRTDMGHLLFLSRSMWANTGCLGVIWRRKFIPFDDEKLISHIGIDPKRRGKAWLKRMVSMSMLRSIDVNLPDGARERQWYINPVHFCPMFLTRQAYLIWRDQVDKFVPEYVKRLFE